MMATIFNSSILNSAILDSAILHKTLTQTRSIWLKLIHSDWTWWWQPSWPLPSWIQPFSTKKTSLIHSDSTWWWQPSWILQCWIQTLPSWIQMTCYLLSDSLKKHSHSILTLTQTSSTWLKLIHSDSTWWWQPSWILPLWIQLFCTKKNFTHSFWLVLIMAVILNSAMLDSDTAILDSDTLSSSLRLTQKHSPCTLTLTQTNSIWLTGWWQPSWILSSWIQPFCTKLWFILIESDSKSFILPQLDDGSHLEFCHLVFSHLHKKTSLMHSHSNWWLQPSWILLSWSQQFCTKKTSLVHSDSTWWWQPSWILPTWIQTLPSWIQTPCYLLSDSLKNTLPLLWFWLKLIPSD